MAKETGDSLLITQLPEEIINLILLKLPAKDIGKVACVSKLFKFIISHPYFLKLHLSTNYAKQQPQALFAYEFHNNNIDFYSCLEYHSGDQSCNCSSSGLCKSPLVDIVSCNCSLYPCQFRVVGSTRGLLCLYKWDAKCSFYTLTLWNPLLSKSKKLPPCPYFDEFRNGVCYSEVVMGFAFDQATIDFKLVMTVFDSRLLPRPGGGLGYRAKFCIYSEKYKSWSNSIRNTVLPCYILPTFSRTAVSLNGVAYWLARKTRHVGDYCIIGFDLVNEVFKDDQVLELPQEIRQNHGDLELTRVDEQEESLALFANMDNSRFRKWTVWVMNIKNQNTGWEKRYNLELDELFTPECLVNSGTKVLVSVDGIGRICGVIDVNTKHVKDLQACSLPKSAWKRIPFVPSLALLDVFVME